MVAIVSYKPQGTSFTEEVTGIVEDFIHLGEYLTNQSINSSIHPPSNRKTHYDAANFIGVVSSDQLTRSQPFRVEQVCGIKAATAVKTVCSRARFLQSAGLASKV